MNKIHRVHGIFRNIDSLCLFLKDEIMVRFFVQTDVVSFPFKFNEQKVSKTFLCINHFR